MGDWLIRDFTIFGVTGGQNWMLIALAIVVLSIAASWWSRR
jgi:hypothetical protein